MDHAEYQYLSNSNTRWQHGGNYLISNPFAEKVRFPLIVRRERLFTDVPTKVWEVHKLEDV
jgi:hypothetical protein